MSLYSSDSSDEEGSFLDDLDENIGESSIDYYGDNNTLKGLRNIASICASIIPMTFEIDQTKKQYKTRSVYQRQREEGHARIYADYFADNAKYPLSYFRRRFRMRRPLFLRILHDIESYDSYFKQRYDAIGRLGLSSLQKMTAAIKMLSTGCSGDTLDEYIQIGESTTNDSLRHFCSAIIGMYQKEYMRAPNHNDMIRLLAQGEARGFPGMLGSLDCMHWVWKNCPTAWHGTHAGAPHKAPTLILEAVADKDLWIWHAFFGMAGTHNDINVLDRSPLFDEIINGRAPEFNYTVNGNQYKMGYYLTDGIYPKYATLIQTIAQPIGPKNSLFAKIQEAVRKDVERAFGVLQARFAIVKGPARFWHQRDLAQVMKTCIILHNMIVDDERNENIETWQPPPSEVTQNVHTEHYSDLFVARLVDKLKKVRDTKLHDQLKRDLIEHIWTQHGEGLLE